MGSEKDAFQRRDAITLGGSAIAEFVADIFLCPYEACRIRAVSDPGYADGMMAVGKKLVGEMGVVNGLYSGFGPMLFKQERSRRRRFHDDTPRPYRSGDGICQAL